VAIVLVWILTAIYLTLYWNFGAIASILNSSIFVPIGLLLPLFAAGVFPILKPDLYKRLFGSMKGAATLSITGFVGAIGFAIYIVSEITPIVSGTFLGASLDLAYEGVVALALLGVGIYLLGRRRMKNAGVDPSKIFAEIPPE